MTPDFIDPATWQQIVDTLKNSAGFVKELLSIRDRIGQRKPRRKLDEELDNLERDVQRVIDILANRFKADREFKEKLIKLLWIAAEGIETPSKALLILDTRLKALEERARGKRPTQKRKGRSRK